MSESYSKTQMKEPQWKENNEGFKSNTQQLLEDTHRPDADIFISLFNILNKERD